MKSGVVAALAALAGGLVAGTIVAWSRDAAAVPLPAEAPLPEARQAEVTSKTDLGPLVARLDAMNERLGRIEQRLAAAPVAVAPVRENAAVPPASVAIDAGSLQHALEEIERRKLDALSDDELLRGARIAGKGDVDEAIRRLRALLARPLTPEKRAEALLDLGMQLRTRGTVDSLVDSARTLQSVVDTAGLDSPTGRDAAYQLIWTYSQQKDSARGLAAARAYLDTPNLTRHERMTGRWATAILMQDSGDASSARRDYLQLLNEIGDSADFAKLATDIRQRLAKL